MLVKEQPYFEHDLSYMQHAYDLSLKAFELNEVPIGAVIVDPSGKIIGLGYNRTEIEKCQSAHAEVIAIKNACENMNDWRLEGCTLYVTLQPCMICYGLSALSRIERIVYGATSPIYGFHIDSKDLPGVYTKHTKFFSSGVMEGEIKALLKRFFKLKRE
ncbi:MAG: nucleoside deaminase [Candidatus Babeliaceae bacterium]|nr:nucleoside deaminase [Candidatus Babeliaceae bacterium]